MLVLERKQGETIMIGEIGEIRVIVVAIEGNRVKLGVEAERDVPIWRGELYEKIRRERQEDTA